MTPQFLYDPATHTLTVMASDDQGNQVIAKFTIQTVSGVLFVACQGQTLSGVRVNTFAHPDSTGMAQTYIASGNAYIEAEFTLGGDGLVHYKIDANQVIETGTL